MIITSERVQLLPLALGHIVKILLCTFVLTKNYFKIYLRLSESISGNGKFLMVSQDRRMPYENKRARLGYTAVRLIRHRRRSDPKRAAGLRRALSRPPEDCSAQSLTWIHESLTHWILHIHVLHFWMQQVLDALYSVKQCKRAHQANIEICFHSLACMTARLGVKNCCQLIEHKLSWMHQNRIWSNFVERGILDNCNASAC